jgi:hypothetical protein
MPGPQPSTHRLGPGLPGYLIPFAPLAFAPQRQNGAQRIAFATGVPSDLYAFHRSTGSSIRPYPPRAPPYPGPFPGWAGGFHPGRATPPTRPLSPVIPNNVRTVRLTAAAGTNLARASSGDRLPPPRQRFTTRRPSSRTRRRSVRLAPIAEDPRLQPPVGVWPVSQCQWRGSCSHTR